MYRNTSSGVSRNGHCLHIQVKSPIDGSCSHLRVGDREYLQIFGPTELAMSKYKLACSSTSQSSVRLPTAILGHVMWDLLWRNDIFSLNFTFIFFLSCTENVTYWLGLLYYLINFFLLIEIEFQCIRSYLPFPPFQKSMFLSLYTKRRNVKVLPNLNTISPILFLFPVLSVPYIGSFPLIQLYYWSH